MARLFVAIELPADVAAALAALRADLPDARWVRPAQLHLTLRFLGEVRAEAVPAVTGALDSLEAQAFELALAGVGVFPGGRKPPRVLWAGVRPADGVADLRRTVDAALDPVLGPDVESAGRPFVPHLTLARLEDRPRGPAVPRFLTAHAALASAAWRVAEVVLFQSHLASHGATHVALTRRSLRDG